MIFFFKNDRDKHLKNAANCTSFEYRGRFITDEGLCYISNIEELRLYQNKLITNEGLQHLTNCKVLILRSNRNITNQGIEHLSNCQELRIGDVVPSNFHV